MIRPEIATKAVVRNPVAAIAAALLPGAVVRLPVACPMLLPGSLPDMLLCQTLARGRWGPLLPVVLLLFTDDRKLPLRSLVRSLLLLDGLALCRSRLPLLLAGGLLLPAR